jgi:O-antigen ligase
MAALLLLPGGLVVYFAFNSGGFHPGAPAYVAIILCLVLVGRLAFSSAPFAGISRLWLLATAAFAAFALLTLLSGAWSHAPGVARVEFDLPLVYLLTMLVFGSIPRTRPRLRWMLRGFATAAVVVCGAGLITRTLPHVWPTTPTIVNNRLSFPITYWNVLGLLAALGIVLCVHLSSDLREPRVSRVLGAGAVPILASTLLFTFSRGAMATCIVALVAYSLIGRPRGLLSSVLAAGPAAAIAVKVAYDANLLATLDPTTAGAVAQGRHVATVVVLCAVGASLLRAVLALVLDEPLRGIHLPAHVRAPVAWTGWGAIAAAAVIAAVALNGTITREYHRFLHPSLADNPADTRARLSDPSNTGRLDQWKVAWHQFERRPVFGQGAGMFANTWARRRPTPLFVVDAHSLYLETLDELGGIGLVLLLIPMVTVLARVASRARGRGRPLYGAVFAVLLGWALHAGVDWDWEMPVVTVVFFALGGFVLARRGHPDGRPRPDPRLPTGWPSRAAVGIACALVAVLPAFTWLSQRKLDDAAYAFSHGNCEAARQAALSSISILGNRPQPYEIVSYCDVRLGMPQAALASIRNALALDPNDWNYHYDLAVMQAAAGQDPRAAARQALSMDPREPLVQQEWVIFRTGNRARWRSTARNIANSFSSL